MRCTQMQMNIKSRRALEIWLLLYYYYYYYYYYTHVSSPGSLNRMTSMLAWLRDVAVVSGRSCSSWGWFSPHFRVSFTDEPDSAVTTRDVVRAFCSSFDCVVEQQKTPTAQGDVDLDWKHFPLSPLLFVFADSCFDSRDTDATTCRTASYQRRRLTDCAKHIAKR